MKEEKDLLSQLQNQIKKDPHVFYTTESTVASLRKAISAFNTEAVRFIIANTDSKTTKNEIINLALRSAFSVPFVFAVKKMVLDDNQQRELCRIIHVIRDAGAELSLKEDPNNQCYLRLLEFLLKHQSDILNAADPQRILSNRCALMFITRLINLDQGRATGISRTHKIKPETMSKTMTQLKKVISQFDLRTCNDEEINQLLATVAPLIQEIIVTRDSFVPPEDIKVLIELNTELKLDKYIDQSDTNAK